MSSFTITCDRCKCTLDHVCRPDLRREVIDLYKRVLEGDYRATLKRSKMYEENSEKMPFFSEAFLYPLLGKDSARSVLSAVSSIIRAAGLEAHELQEVAWIELVQSKVTLTYEPSGDHLALRMPGFVKKTMQKRSGLRLLIGREPKSVLGMGIPQATRFESDQIPEVLWLKDAFNLWKSKLWKVEP